MKLEIPLPSLRASLRLIFNEFKANNLGRLKVYLTLLQLLDEYRRINIKLNEKPSSIEHIYEIKEWMETVPVTMKGHEDTQRRYMLVKK